MSAFGTIKPVQDNLQIIRNSTAFGNLLSLYGLSNKAYLGLNQVRNSTAFGSLLQSTYQVVGPQGIIPSDSFAMTDDVIITGIWQADDSLILTDDAPIVSAITDSMVLTDSVILSGTWYVDDSLSLADTFSDELVEQVTANDDSMPFTEQAGVFLDHHFSFGCQIALAQYYHTSQACEVDVKNYTPASTNLPSSDPSNILQSTVIIDGNTFSSYASTNPGVPPSTSFFVSFLEKNIIGVCDIVNYSMSQSLGSDGQFEVISQTQPPNATIGNTITVNGLMAVVTESYHQSRDSSGNAWVTRGIFGDSRQLNKKVLLVLQNAPGSIAENAGNIYLAQPPSIQWKTVALAASAIANYAGISFSWLCQDATLTDVFLETNMTVGDALRSLAARVGAIVTWDGKHGWVAVTPDKGYGGWSGPPSCNLYYPNGLRAGNLLDINQGITQIPIQSLSQSVVQTVPNPLLTPPPNKVIQFHVIDDYMKSDAPNLELTVQGDFKNPGMVQVLVNTADVGPTWTTSDPNNWFVGPWNYLIAADKTRKISIAPSDIPTGLPKGKFHMNIGYVRDTTALEDLHLQTLAALVQKKQMKLKAQQERIRYFRLQGGDATMQYSGTCPLAGNNVSLNYDGITFNGIIESWNLAYPGVLSLQLGLYVNLDLQTPLSILDAFQASGGP